MLIIIIVIVIMIVNDNKIRIINQAHSLKTYEKHCIVFAYFALY